MNALQAYLQSGGWVMGGIAALSVVLYSRVFGLLLRLRRVRRSWAGRAASSGDAQWLERCERLEEQFGHERHVLGAMIAAAPLLGLLGTVGGMEKTFFGLAAAGGAESMDNLAAGIAEVLVATQSGLMVAIPALLLVYSAHRQVQRIVAMKRS